MHTATGITACKFPRLKLKILFNNIISPERTKNFRALGTFIISIQRFIYLIYYGIMQSNDLKI